MEGAFLFGETICVKTPTTPVNVNIPLVAFVLHFMRIQILLLTRTIRFSYTDDYVMPVKVAMRKRYLTTLGTLEYYLEKKGGHSRVGVLQSQHVMRKTGHAPIPFTEMGKAHVRVARDEVDWGSKHTCQ
ncbi:hypothetical protein JHK82_034828 [Glycine max]|nr:hypothetical protein JHK82_034828 [Glycine max]